MVGVIRGTCFVMVVGLAVIIGSITIATAGVPELYIDSHYDGETGNSEKITVYGHVRGSGGAVVELVTVNGVNATGDTEWSAEVPLHPGENTMAVIATDDIGNSATRTITVILDVEPTPTPAEEPKLYIDSHYDGKTVSAEKITVYGHVRGTGGAVVELVTVNGVKATGDTEWSAEVPLHPGENTITVVATDDIGNSATRTITVILASEPIPIPAGEPKLSIDSHYDGETVNAEKITVYGHVRGTGGAVVELVTVNGVNATGDTEWSADVSLLPGPNTITVIATDDIGDSATRTITVILASELTPIPTYKIYNMIRTVSYPQIIYESTKDVLVGV